jgi:hypothetical protein
MRGFAGGMIEERHGFPGALRASGGLGGPVAAPHLNRRPPI